MAVLSGPDLERLADSLRSWYAQAKEHLVGALSQDYPYGAVKLSRAEQLQQFLEMTPEDWQAFLGRLRDRYQGYPDASTRIFRELSRYVRRMRKLEARARLDEARTFGLEE